MSENPVAPSSREELVARIREIEADCSLQPPPMPHPPSIVPSAPMKSNLRNIQRYISSLEYNHTGESYFPVRKDRGMSRIVRVAKSIMQECLPIQCVEAVFLATFQTMPLRTLDRFPLSFKSSVDGTVYRHIVLAVRHAGSWGALGISRKRRLMDKPLQHPSLSALVAEYQAAYAAYGHQLVKVYIGLPFAHGDTTSAAPIQWRTCRVRVDCFPPERVAAMLDSFGHAALSFSEDLARSGKKPPPFVLTAKSLPASEQDDLDTSSDETAPRAPPQPKRSPKAAPRVSKH